MKKGINQKGRLSAALDSSYVKPDERTFLDLIQFTLSYAETVNFFDLENHPSSSWKPFLLSDPVFVIGSIAEMDLNINKKVHESLLLKLEESNRKKNEIKGQIATNLLSLSRNLFIWEDLLISSGYQGTLLNEIKNATNYLESNIRNLLKLQEKYVTRDFGLYSGNSLERGEVDLKESFKLIFKNLMFIKEKAAEKFELQKVESDKHHPHIGLILSFLRLFQTAQNELNKLLDRHLDYYYEEILMQKDSFPKQMTAYVGLQGSLDDVPESTQLEMTFSDQSKSPFSTLSGLKISKTKITDLRTVYQNLYKPFSDSVIGDASELNSIFDACLYQGEAKDTLEIKESINGFPKVLGENQEGFGISERNMDPSIIGLVITSPVLILEEGKHQIKIRFKFSSESFNDFENKMGLLFHEKEKVEKNFDVDLNSFVQQFINDAFVVTATGFKGWFELDYHYFSINQSERSLELFLEPEGSEEFLVAFDSKIHSGLKGLNWPCIRLILNSNASLPPFSALNALEIIELDIETNSKDVRSGIFVSNQLGQLDTSNPFQPFGPLPCYDSYLKIRSPKILNRNLEELSLSIFWANLPLQRNGFTSHYEAYPDDIDNKSFEAEILSVSKQMKGNPPSNKNQKVCLFDTSQKADGEYLKSLKEIKVNLELLDPSNFPPLGNLKNLSQEPAFYLKLKKPAEMAFGHAIYPELFAAASMRTGWLKKSNGILPKTPYTPVIDHFHINYSNRAKENLTRFEPSLNENIRLLHIYPFGYDQVYPGIKKNSSFFLPQINVRGSLVIGLTDSVPEEIITLGFDLIPAYRMHTISSSPNLDWEYLENNSWYPLGNRLLEDSTENLIHPGIVRLKLPKINSRNNSILPAGKLWIRVANRSSIDLNSKIKAVFVNAVKVQEVRSQVLDRQFQTNANPISAAVPTLKLIEKVSGPYGLRKLPAYEIEKHQRARSSEILKHRNRAVDGWDVERLVLEQFPEIGRVMVYGRSDFSESVVIGSNIQVVVVPVTFDSSKNNPSLLRVPLGLLQDIKEYLENYLSPFSSLEVCNPVFEKLKVRCAVKFIEDQRAGYFRDLLERELIGFLAPDPVKDSKGKGFINSIYKSEIQGFIESRPYVLFATKLSVLQIIDVEGSYKIIDTATTEYSIELLRTITPYAILTSAEEHFIEIFTKEQLENPTMAGIGDLSIDSDFIIKK
ncbi:hypothetical protein JYB64_08710 [Algoriphagus aestuarii]|nr:hypothetical protein [Algoriphagus aestuarii]